MFIYKCQECDDKSFVAWFKPEFDQPAFCPNCGSDKKVNYLGQREYIQQDELEGIV